MSHVLSSVCSTQTSQAFCPIRFQKQEQEQQQQKTNKQTKKTMSVLSKTSSYISGLAKTFQKTVSRKISHNTTESPKKPISTLGYVYIVLCGND